MGLLYLPRVDPRRRRDPSNRSLAFACVRRFVAGDSNGSRVVGGTRRRHSNFRRFVESCREETATLSRYKLRARDEQGRRVHVRVRPVPARVPVRSRVARSNASAATTVGQTVSIYVRIKMLGYQIRARTARKKGCGKRERALASEEGGRFGKWIVRLFPSKRGCAAANKIHQLVSPLDGRASRSS